MRHNFNLLAGGALTLLLVGAASSAQAQTVYAQDNAADPAYNGGTFNGLNGGTGFGAWSVAAPAGGSFIGDSTKNNGGSSGGINTSGKSFGIYSGGAQTTATRPLTTPLAIGQTLSLDFDNGYINSGAGQSVGFFLSNGASTPLTVFFNGGDSQYRVLTPAGTTGTAINFTGNGLHADFTLTSATAYTFSLKPAGGAAYVQTGAYTGAGVNSLSFFNNNAGSGPNFDVFANNLSVTTPAPSALLPMAGGLTVLFGSLKRRKRK